MEDFLKAVGLLISVAAPIIVLNTNIVKLTTTIEHLMQMDKVQDERLKTHGEQIDKLTQNQIENEGTLRLHEQRLKSLEKKEERHECI